MKLWRRIIREGALLARPFAALLGIKKKTVAGKLPDVLEALDHALPPESPPKP